MAQLTDRGPVEGLSSYKPDIVNNAGENNGSARALVSRTRYLWGHRNFRKYKRETKLESAMTEATNYKVLLEYQYDYEGEDGSTDLSYLLAPSPSSPGPYIDKYHSSNVTALAGVTTALNCRVHKLGNKTVSWIKQASLHLLTVGRYTYTPDLRFEASHTPHSLDWTLTIRDPHTSDSGLYQCQVSTTPHMSTTIWLEVKGKIRHQLQCT